MKIQGSNPEQIRPGATRGLPPDSNNASEANKPAPGAAAPRNDSVEISDAGRALAGGADAQRTSGLSAERAAEIRTRILEGAYNSAAIVDKVARRILDQGDV
jgi:anti-sigma28 factor (negative regulator of flagellin synthesis)